VLQSRDRSIILRDGEIFYDSDGGASNNSKDYDRTDYSFHINTAAATETTITTTAPAIKSRWKDRWRKDPGNTLNKKELLVPFTCALIINKLFRLSSYPTNNDNTNNALLLTRGQKHKYLTLELSEMMSGTIADLSRVQSEHRMECRAQDGLNEDNDDVIINRSNRLNYQLFPGLPISSRDRLRFGILVSWTLLIRLNDG